MATHFLIRYSDNHCETALHIHIHYVTYIIVECIHVATTPLELFKPWLEKNVAKQVLFCTPTH